jgi:hypothetical protein
MNDPSSVVHEIASGDICLWVDPCGAIMLKVMHQSNVDPVELNKDEAVALAEVLMRLAKDL